MENKEILRKQKELEERFNIQGPFIRFKTDFELLILLIEDIYKRECKRIPRLFLSTVLFAAIYFPLNPLLYLSEFFPDPDILFIGDVILDVLVFAACFTIIELELHEYKNKKLESLEKLTKA